MEFRQKLSHSKITAILPLPIIMVRKIEAPLQSSPVRTLFVALDATHHSPTVNDVSKLMTTAKPSEIRAASKAGRAAVKAEREKQERMLKEQHESQMKMNKIRAEIEAIKKKEKADNEKGSLGSDYKNLTGKYIPYTEGKQSDIDDTPFPISSERELEKLSPQRNRVIFVRRGSVIAPDKIPDKKNGRRETKNGLTTKET